MTLLDTCYLHGGIGRPPNEVQRRFSDGDPEQWAARAAAVGSSATALAGAAVHSVRAVAPEEMEIVGAWADERDAPLHAHISEQPAENEDCAAAYGRTPVEVLVATPGSSAAGAPPSTPPTSPPRTSPRSAAGTSASARRRSGTWPTASARRPHSSRLAPACASDPTPMR